MPRRTKPPVLDRTGDMPAIQSAALRFELLRAHGELLARGPTREAVVTSASAMWGEILVTTAEGQDDLVWADGVVRGSIRRRGRAA